MQAICVICKTTVESSNGMCPQCNNIVVAKALVDALTTHQKAPTPVVPDKYGDKPYCVLVSYGGWETAILETIETSQALSVAKHDKQQPWYMSVDPNANVMDLGFKARVITHNEYCDWLRRH
jgi:hypothetical protein